MKSRPTLARLCDYIDALMWNHPQKNEIERAYQSTWLIVHLSMRGLVKPTEAARDRLNGLLAALSK